MNKTASIAALLATFFVVAPAHAAAPAEITTCGQVLDGDGFLSADLDCSGDTTNGHTVTLGRGATLSLNGFTLTGRHTTGTGGSGMIETVVCQGTWTTAGGGNLS